MRNAGERMIGPWRRNIGAFYGSGISATFPLALCHPSFVVLLLLRVRGTQVCVQSEIHFCVPSV